MKKVIAVILTVIATVSMAQADSQIQDAPVMMQADEQSWTEWMYDIMPTSETPSVQEVVTSGKPYVATLTPVEETTWMQTIAYAGCVTSTGITGALGGILASAYSTLAIAGPAAFWAGTASTLASAGGTAIGMVVMAPAVFAGSYGCYALTD